MSDFMESRVLCLELDVPFWCSFRDPTGINVHTTFRLPPLTALYGLVANAVNLPQDDYSLRARLRFAVGIRRPGELVETYSKIMKVREAKTPEEAAKPGNIFISTSVIKQKIIRPNYRVWILAEREILSQLQSALLDPARPLYLGESDDVVDVVDPAICMAIPTQMDHLNCAVPFTGREVVGQDESPASMVNLPYNFTQRGRNDWGLQRRLYAYRPDGRLLRLDQPIAAYDVEGQGVVFEPPILEQNA